MGRLTLPISAVGLADPFTSFAIRACTTVDFAASVAILAGNQRGLAFVTVFRVHGHLDDGKRGLTVN